MISAVEILQSHAKLSAREKISNQRIDILRAEIEKNPVLKNANVSIFCAGSIARGEFGESSDLDLFLAYNGEAKQASGIELDVKAELRTINDSLGYPPLSDSGRYLTLHTIDHLVSSTGSRIDDSENRFTVRLLMLLEGVSLNSNELFDAHKYKILKNYFRDQTNTKVFSPYFLLNDILRYWRTLCLNYEEFRCDRSRLWRKRSINLKFSRMLTVFATVLPLISLPIRDVDKCFELTKFRPLERMAIGLDALESELLCNMWRKALDHYEFFLQQKEKKELDKEQLSPEDKAEIVGLSVEFSNFIHRALSEESIDPLLRKALIL